MAPTVTALVNQKGGVAKSTSCINLGAALVQEGKRVLLVDTDPQASMTIALGNQQPDNLPITMADLMAKVMNDQQLTPGEGILHHSEGMDLLPSSIALAGTEVSLVNAMSRESTLKFLLNDYRKDYDHILIVYTQLLRLPAERFISLYPRCLLSSTGYRGNCPSS